MEKQITCRAFDPLFLGDPKAFHSNGLHTSQ